MRPAKKIDQALFPREGEPTGKRQLESGRRLRAAPPVSSEIVDSMADALRDILRDEIRSA
jgi:hypothetical protein